MESQAVGDQETAFIQFTAYIQSCKMMEECVRLGENHQIIDQLKDAIWKAERLKTSLTRRYGSKLDKQMQNLELVDGHMRNVIPRDNPQFLGQGVRRKIPLIRNGEPENSIGASAMVMPEPKPLYAADCIGELDEMLQSREIDCKLTDALPLTTAKYEE